MENEIIFSGNYKQFKIERRYDLKDGKCGDVSAILVELSDLIEKQAYEFSGIDIKKVDELINVGSGLGSVISFLKTIKRDTLLPAAQGKKTMIAITESYLLNQVFKKAGVKIKPQLTTSIEPKEEKSEDQIAFIGSFNGWFAAKKLSIDTKTHDWEVSAILCGINNTIVNKSFDFAELKGSVTGQGRKSLNNVATALSVLNDTNPYTIVKTCENFGIKPYASPEMLTDEYPDVKPPKVKGRKAKG